MAFVVGDKAVAHYQGSSGDDEIKIVRSGVFCEVRSR